MELLGKSLLELKKMLDSKEISAVEMQQYFLDRINRYNDDLNAFVTITDCEQPLGLPLAIKDNVCTKGVRTTASAKVLDDFIPPYDATIMQKLKVNGVTILGKTNLDAWAHGSSTETSDYGPSRNPWDLTRAPGGSSGGSAAAVAAYLAPAAIGTETAGSIRQPASWSGIIGLKPTYGRVSRYGIVAMGSSFDCPGPMGIKVDDVAYLLGQIAGKDPYDATSLDDPVEDYMALASEGKKYTIGICDDYFEGVDEGTKSKVEEVIKILEKMGHKTKRVSLLSPEYSMSIYTILQRSEVSSNLARYTGVRYGNDRTTFGKEALKRMLLGGYSLSAGYAAKYYTKAQAARRLVIDDFKKVFTDVDMIVSPTTPITALPIGESEKYPFFGEKMDVLNEPAAVAGLPGITVPAGLDQNNLPVGIQFVANYLKEGALLDISKQLENETDFFGVIKQGFDKWK